MKIVLLKDVPNIGKAGTVKEISDGYAKNYLIPKKLAAPHGSAENHEVEAKLKAKEAKKAKEIAELTELAKELNGKSLDITSKSGSSGKLFGRITETDIAKAINSSLKISVDKRKISLAKPIRQTGQHEAVLRFGHGISCTININVTGEEAS